MCDVGKKSRSLYIYFFIRKKNLSRCLRDSSLIFCYNQIMRNSERNLCLISSDKLVVTSEISASRLSLSRRPLKTDTFNIFCFILKQKEPELFVEIHTRERDSSDLTVNSGTGRTLVSRL